MAERPSQQGEKGRDHLAEYLRVKPLGFLHEGFQILRSPNARNPFQSNSLFWPHRMSPFYGHAFRMGVFNALDDRIDYIKLASKY